MANFPSKEEVREAKATYPKGTRVELIEMDDPYTKLVAGDKGTVKHVDDAGGIHIAWDKGSSLAALLGVDRIKII